MMASFVSGSPTLETRDTIRKSVDMASSKPPPRANPSIIEIVGHGIV